MDFYELKPYFPLPSAYNDSIWNDVIQPDKLRQTLNRVIVPKYLSWYKQSYELYKRKGQGKEDIVNKILAKQLNTESALAGFLIYLKDNKHFEKLKDIFYKFHDISGIVAYLKYQDPLDACCFIVWSSIFSKL